MRLKKVETEHGFAKLLMKGAARLLGMRVPDVVRTTWYRPELFGRPFTTAVQRALRGPSRWSAAERELFAAFTSNLNQCPF